jgi:hypothetical protein
VRRDVVPVRPAERRPPSPLDVLADVVRGLAPLGQRTPDEIFNGRDTRAKAVPLRAVVRVEHLRGDRELPVLSLRHAA